MKEFFEKVVNWFSDSANLPWIIAYSLGALFLLFLILFIVYACKAHSRNKKLASIRTDLDIEKTAHTHASDELDESERRAKLCLDENKKLKDDLNSTLDAIKKLHDEVLMKESLLAKADKTIADLKVNVESLKLENESLKASKVVETKEPVQLEPEVSAIKVNETTETAKVEETPIAESDAKITVSRPKNGMFKYTLATLNNIAESLGVSGRKTKNEVIIAIKYILVDKKVTKAQVMSAMKIVGITTISSSDTKDKLIEQLRKELNK